MCNFKIGDPVVCINSDGWYDEISLERDVSGPEYNDVLKIRDIQVISGSVYLLFFEYTGKEDQFHSSNFRPLESSYTEEELASVDISPLIEELELETV